MTQGELIKNVTVATNTKLESAGKKVTEGVVKEVVSSFVDVTKEAVSKGDKVSISGFGTFETVERAAREGRNPSTGEAMHIPASKAPKFKAAKAFKELVNA